MVDPIGTSFQSMTYSYAQQYAYDPRSTADYNYRVEDTTDGGKTYHMVHVPNDPGGSQYQYTVTVTDASTNRVSIVESFSSGSNTYSGQIVSHNGGAFVVSASSPGSSSFEWLFTNVATYDGYITVYPNSSPQAQTFVPACYAAGTRILTVKGEVVVEDLRQGDLVVTQDGTLQPVVWLGFRATNPARWPHPDDAAPIRVRAHAFGDNLPHRDLRLSPGHAVLWEGALIPICHLINDVTIVREAANPVTYYHVELPQHAIILAEGLPAESYLDVGNRAGFTNGGPLAALRPQFDPQGSSSGEYAPRICDGDLVDEARRTLIARAEQLGYGRTGDAAMRLLVDGEELLPVREEGGSVVFNLPARPVGAVSLLSRSAAPAWTQGTADARRLGIAIEGLVLRGDGIEVYVAADASALSAGFHKPECRDGAVWRWTDGDAQIPSSLFATITDDCELTVRIRACMTYWLPASQPSLMQMASLGDRFAPTFEFEGRP